MLHKKTIPLGFLFWLSLVPSFSKPLRVAPLHLVASCCLPLPEFSFLILAAFAPVMGLCSYIRSLNSFTDKDASIQTTHGIYESSSGLEEDEQTPA